MVPRTPELIVSQGKTGLNSKQKRDCQPPELKSFFPSELWTSGDLHLNFPLGIATVMVNIVLRQLSYSKRSSRLQCKLSKYLDARLYFLGGD